MHCISCTYNAPYTHFVEYTQQYVECVELRLDGILPVDLQLEAVTEELEDGCYQLVSATQVLNVSKSEMKKSSTYNTVYIL